MAKDLPDGFAEKSLAYLDHFEKVLGEFDRLISFNKIFVERLAGVGVISPELARSHGLVGPNLRASGIRYDLRKDEPYSVYDRFDFHVPVGEGWKGEKGDSFDRFYVRVLEMGESVKILRQALSTLPAGEIRSKVPRKIRPPVGEAMARVEAPRGDLMYYLLSDGTEKPYRIKIRTGSFNAMTILEELSPGMYIADLVSFFASLDVVAPEIDR